MSRGGKDRLRWALGNAGDPDSASRRSWGRGDGVQQSKELRPVAGSGMYSVLSYRVLCGEMRLRWGRGASFGTYVAGVL